MKPVAPYRRQSGLTLLEVMVTVVILSLGLLGLAGLQMTGLKNNRNAYYNSVAAQVVQDISERMHVDMINASSGNTYDDITIASGTACSTASFSNRVACQLAAIPGGRAWIQHVAGTAPKAFYVAVLWTDPQLGGTNGWGADAADGSNPATTACGNPTADTYCYYSVFRL